MKLRVVVILVIKLLNVVVQNPHAIKYNETIQGPKYIYRKQRFSVECLKEMAPIVLALSQIMLSSSLAMKRLLGHNSGKVDGMQLQFSKVGGVQLQLSKVLLYRNWRWPFQLNFVVKGQTGKTVNMSAMMEDHFGNQSLPPIWKQRVKELGKWVRKEYEINGKWWDSNCADIVAAGLGMNFLQSITWFEREWTHDLGPWHAHIPMVEDEESYVKVTNANNDSESDRIDYEHDVDNNQQAMNFGYNIFGDNSSEEENYHIEQNFYYYS
ncbi:GTP binding domain-containing protein [Artemisia annua]|uniref:GTP binding domain-containing protein n=1 Tax=Artemisia annua TaxID=35608 RepID=A0A2U1QHA6_ARTAN|nr:GTP binding domain-containing protein [Artemisia annua]